MDDLYSNIIPGLGGPSAGAGGRGALSGSRATLIPAAMQRKKAAPATSSAAITLSLSKTVQLQYVATTASNHTGAALGVGGAQPPTASSAAEAGGGDFFPLEVEDEYDPFQPNSFEEVLRDRGLQRLEEEKLEELKRRFEAHQHHAAAAAAAPAVEPSFGHASTPGGPLEEAPLLQPPPAAAGGAAGRGMGRGGVSNLPAWMTQGQGGRDGTVPGAAAAAGGVASSLLASGAPPAAHLGPQSYAAPAAAAAAAASAAGGGGGSIGARLMAKMGYAAGKGLGKDESGITAPLQHMKTGARSGVICAPAPPPSSDAAGMGGGSSEETPDSRHTSSNLLSTVSPPAATAPPASSSVVLLRNMIGPGEVDDDLEGEVKGECEKFGAVRAVYVYECEGQVPPHEAVRIFVQFDGPAAAARALADLNGRFFGGRTVQAAFFSEASFARFAFAP